MGSQQIGWGTEEKLLYDISQQIDRLIGVTSTISGGGGGGTVTSVSVTPNQGISASVTNPTTTPDLTFSIGALVGVTSYNGLIITSNTGVITTGTWNGSKVGLLYGGTNSDLSITGGTSQVLKQSTLGGNITVGIITTSDVTNLPFVTPEDYGAIGNGSTDDSTAINSAISAANTLGKFVLFSEKNYRITAATLSLSFGNSLLKGSGAGSILSTTSNISIVTITSKKNYIENLTFLGNSSGAVQTGINITGNAGLTLDYTSNHITNCEFRSLNFAGIYGTNVLGTTGSVHQGSMYGVNNYFESCGIGVDLDNRSEYNTFVNTVVYACTTGIRVAAGNNNFLGGQITDGTTGIVINTGSNDGKCIFSGIKINHNTTAVTSQLVTLGSLFIGCEMIINGSITITNGVGHSFKNCTINNSTITVSAGVTANTLEFMNCTFNGNPTLTLNAVAVTWLNNTFLAGSAPSGVTNNYTGDAFTFTNNTAALNNITGTWTATANNQYHWNFGGSFTTRNTNTDTLIGYQFSPTLIVNAGAPTGQTGISLFINPTFTGSFSSSVGLQVNNGQTWLGTVTSGAFLAVKSTGTGSSALFRLQNSTPSTLFLVQEDGVFNEASPNSRTTAIVHIAFTQGSFTPSSGVATMDGFKYSSSPGQTGTATGALTNAYFDTSFGSTFTSGTGGNYINLKLNSSSTFTQTGGSASFTQISSTPTYNQTSSASGILTIFDYNPTETAILGAHYFLRSRSLTALSAFGGVTPSAFVTIGAGTTTIAPFKLTSGTNLTTAVAGVMEYDGTSLFFTPTGTTRTTVVLDTVAQTLTNKRINPRVVVMTDATSFTPTGDTADINTQANTQAIGTLTANAPSGTPVNGQMLLIQISSTNVQTFAWNAIYVGCTTTALPTATTGATKTDKFFFQYNSLVSKWQVINAEYGYT